MGCACESCQSFCRQKPGWFTPDQIEPLARKLGIPTEELFRRFLTIDAALIDHGGQMKAIYALAPAMVEEKSGSISDPSARGTCIWFRDGRCQIYDVRPRECGFVDHGTSNSEADLFRASVLKRWEPHKAFVQRLYGKKLKAPDALKKLYRKIQRERGAIPARDG